jgi:hypothetical protein
MENKIRSIDWEKVSIYIAVTAALLTSIIYIADIKERIRALEVKIEYIEKSKTS